MATHGSESMGWWFPRMGRLMLAGCLAAGAFSAAGGTQPAWAQQSTKSKSGTATKGAGAGAAAPAGAAAGGATKAGANAAGTKGANPPGAQIKASSKPAQVDEENLDLLSGEEVGTFLESLGTAIDEGKLADFNRNIDWERISAVASQGFQIPPKSKGKFLAEFRDPQDEETGFSGQVIKSATTGGSYALVKVHEVGRDVRALFRMVLPDDAGFNYHDYVIGRVDGKLKVVDIYIYGSGEMLSSMIRRAMIISAAHQAPEWLKGLQGRDLDMAKAGKMVKEYSDRAGRQDAEGCLALYAKLPATVQKEKGVMLVRLYASTLIDDTTQQLALTELKKSDPRDFAGDLQCLPSYLSGQKYELFQKAIGRLKKEVGGDPYLNVVLADMHVAQQDYASARKLLEEAIAADDTLIDAWWAMVTVCLREQNYAQAVKTLDKLATDFQVDVGDVTRNAEYADFVKSPEYQKWKKPKVAKTSGETRVK
jgi:Tetratricopeptide repeat